MSDKPKINEQALKDLTAELLAAYYGGEYPDNFAIITEVPNHENSDEMRIEATLCATDVKRLDAIIFKVAERIWEKQGENKNVTLN